MTSFYCYSPKDKDYCMYIVHHHNNIYYFNVRYFGCKLINFETIDSPNFCIFEDDETKLINQEEFLTCVNKTLLL